MDTGVSIGILFAFLGGMVSFASPCCLPLVPAYVGYMVGSQPDDGTIRRRAAFSQALAFVLGFSAVFIALWASVGVIGYVLRDNVGTLRQIGGAILVFMGLHVAGVVNVNALHREVHLPVGPTTQASMGFGRAAPSKPDHRRSALLGVVFAAGWTPCIGPILGGIIGLASVRASVAEGTLLLIAYATGLAIPFILVAVGATSLSNRLGWLRAHHTAVSAATGAMLVLVGFLMISNQFARLSSFVAPLGS